MTAARSAKAARPTQEQVDVAREVTRWYLREYHGTPDDPGVLSMFADPSRVGHFAVTPKELHRSDPQAYFRLLVATTMFQRRQDVQIQRVLRGISADDVDGLTHAHRLMESATTCLCPRARSLAAVIEECDLTKTPSGVATCASAPDVPCVLKRHSVLLKRYGHFGKVPTALAHAIHEAGAVDLPSLYAATVATSSGPADAAERLEGALTRAWRISDKIAAMYLSMLTNPDLADGPVPWAHGLDWTRWVVIDSNVDLFLKATAYTGTWTYAARRAFLSDLAAEIDLAALKPGLCSFNPRVVQQAIYLFMSVTNRRASARDCSHLGAGRCTTCPALLARTCPRGPGEWRPSRDAPARNHPARVATE